MGLEELFHPPATHARPTAHVTPVSEHRQPELGVLLHAALAIGVIDAEAPAEAPAVPAAKKSCLRWYPVDPVEQRAKRQRAKRPRSNVRFCRTVSDNDGKTTPLMEEFDWPRKVRRTGIGDGSTTVGDGSGTGVGDGIGTGVGDGTSTVVGDVSGTAVGDGIGTNDNAGAVGALVGAANGDWIDGKNTSSACLLGMEPGERRSTYLNVMRCINKEATDDELVAEVDAMDKNQMISPLERLVRAGRLTLFVDRDDGKLKVGLYDLPPADLHAAEARAEALKVRLVSVAL